MNTWKTLYIKEIKDNRTLFVLLPLVTVFLELVAVLSFDDGQVAPSPHFLWSFVPYAFLLILPFVLSHSFAQEVKGQTHYLLLSLPVSRTQIFAAKAAAVATARHRLIRVEQRRFHRRCRRTACTRTRGEENVITCTIFPSPVQRHRRDILVIIGVFYLSAMAVMLGIAGGASGLKLVVRRFAGLASTAFVLGVLYFYFSTLPDVLDLIRHARKYSGSTDDSNEPIGLDPESFSSSVSCSSGTRSSSDWRPWESGCGCLKSGRSLKFKWSN